MPQEIRVPDLGNISEALVIELSISQGQSIEKDTTILTLESDKAAMDIPSPAAGLIEKLFVKKGDKLKTGALIATLKSDSAAATPQVTPDPEQKVAPPPQTPQPAVSSSPPPQAVAPLVSRDQPDHPSSGQTLAYAGPSVRQLARVLGVDLNEVKGSGHRDRITREDVESFVKQALKGRGMGGSASLGGISLSPPDIDYSQWGSIETQPLSRIKQRTAQNLQAAWLQIPRVTHVDEADITELESFRKELAQSRSIKLSILPFILKAYAHTLKRFPTFNASLNPAVDGLILKHDVHLGVAVDTPQGLVVPVLKEVLNKGILELASELNALSEKARLQKLTPQDFQGASSTVSSLGGIGGTVFTPIVNLPNVAILGVCRSAIKPVYQNGAFVPRLLLPLSLSYDHRAIDGAEAARFVVELCRVLSDMRHILL